MLQMYAAINVSKTTEFCQSLSEGFLKEASGDLMAILIYLQPFIKVFSLKLLVSIFAKLNLASLPRCIIFLLSAHPFWYYLPDLPLCLLKLISYVRFATLGAVVLLHFKNYSYSFLLIFQSLGILRSLDSLYATTRL